MTTKRILNWKRDFSDHRDQLYQPRLLRFAALPESASVAMPPIVDQGSESSCVGNAVARAMGHLQPKYAPLARNMLYGGGRAIEGDFNRDDGTMIRDVVKYAHQTGACLERNFPYSKKTLFKKPTAENLAEALGNRIAGYKRIDHTKPELLQACLASGLPFVFGFSVPESFLGKKIAATGIMELPGPNEPLVGGHAVVCRGFNRLSGYYDVDNSWGNKWGLLGMFEMPFAFMHSRLCSDFWVLEGFARMGLGAV